MWQWIQMGHRAAAGLIFVWIGFIMILAIKHYRHQKIMFWGWILSFVLVSLQVVAGGFIIFTSGNLLIALLHAFLIACLFGMLSYFILLTYRSNANSIRLKPHSEQVLNTESKTSPII
jgi:cytochrome c oxidase assembly protein subunit 15